MNRLRVDRNGHNVPYHLDCYGWGWGRDWGAWVGKNGNNEASVNLEEKKNHEISEILKISSIR